MTYIVNESCIKCKLMDCVEVCPFAMYALIIVIAVLSPAGGAVTRVGVTSQVLGKFKNLDPCKTTGSQQGAGGATSDLSLSRGIYWYCAYTGAK